MHRTPSVFVAALTLAALAPPAGARPRVLEGSDPAAAPLHEAATGLVKAMAADDAKAIDAAFAGTGDDRKLLDATTATVAATAALADAMAAKFGDAAVPANQRHPTDGEVRAIGYKTAVIDSAKPDHASLSPGLFPFTGYELDRRDGRWVVTAITVFPKDVPALLTANRQLAPAAADLAKRVAAGEYATADAARAAIKARVGPILDAYQAATRKGPRPSTAASPPRR